MRSIAHLHFCFQTPFDIDAFIIVLKLRLAAEHHEHEFVARGVGEP